MTSQDGKEDLRNRFLEALDQHMRECDKDCKVMIGKVLAHWATKHPEKGMKLLKDGGIIS